MSAPRAVCTQKKVFLDKPAPLTIRFLWFLFPITNFFQAMRLLSQVGSLATAWTGESASSASATENSAKLSPIKSGTGIAQMIRLPKTVSVLYFDAKLYNL